MSKITRQKLQAYLDDELVETEMAQVEKALRASGELRAELEEIRQSSDHGEHTIGGIWTEEHLTCPTREQLGSYLLKSLPKDYHDYIEFHLTKVGCPFCQANLEDLRSLQQSDGTTSAQRRKRLYDTTQRHIQGRSTRGND